VNRRTMTLDEWQTEGRKRFGDDEMQWKFKCPACGYVASVADYKAAKAGGGVAFSCIGRWVGAAREAFGGKGRGPCNYAGGGLFGLNPVHVEKPDGTSLNVFEFAEG
jgi:hypothetical protein